LGKEPGEKTLKFWGKPQNQAGPDKANSKEKERSGGGVGAAEGEGELRYRGQKGMMSTNERTAKKRGKGPETILSGQKQKGRTFSISQRGQTEWGGISKTW